jgi:hypothetical protein
MLMKSDFNFVPLIRPMPLALSESDITKIRKPAAVELDHFLASQKNWDSDSPR